MADIALLQIANTLTELKAMIPTTEEQKVLLVGKDSVGDGKGGFYRWDATDTTSQEDTAYLNVVVSSIEGVTGRWVRIFQRAKMYGSNILVMNGGVKTLYCPTTTDSSGKATVYPTTTGAVGGTPLFTEVWQLNGTVNSAAATVDAVIVGSGSISVDRKTVGFTFVRNNSTTLGGSLLAILGLLIPGLRAAPGSIPVYITVEGI